MDKYRKLISNTIIFAIGTFSSKVLVFLLMPLYTRVLSPDDFGIVDLVVQTSNLIIPIVSIGISNAIIRFGLDRAYDKRDVFSGGIVVIGAGYLLFLLLYPLLARVPVIEGHTGLIYLYVLTSCLRSLCSQFVRAKELVKLYAFDGVASTLTVITFNILFLVVFRMGINGYVLATILSDLISAVFLFSIVGLHRYVRFKKMDWPVLGSMLRYTVPLIPTTVFWWITNVSDRYLVTYMISAQANGLYAVAYKIPTMIMLVSGIFSDAWQMSAITEAGSGRDRFFSNVFAAYQAIIFTAASGLILLTKPITRILVSEAFYESWRHIPFLVLATAFSCFVTFLGSIYMVEKKTTATLATTVFGAVANIVLNLILIPKYGVNGAAFATFASYFSVFLIRAADTRRLIKINWSALKLAFSLGILLLQSWILLTFPDHWILPEALLCLLMTGIHFKMLLVNIHKVFPRIF